MKKEGVEKGEVCNRDDCKGIIEEKDLDGGCSCHIHPPCSYCETDPNYCPVCDWDAEEEIDIEWQERAKNYKPPIFKKVKKRTLEDLDKTRIDFIAEQRNGHLSTNKRGVAPLGTSYSGVVNSVKGSFGGRMEMFSRKSDHIEFFYIAYND